MQSFCSSSDYIEGRVSFTMEITWLIERCRQGDSEALGELYKMYAHRMRGVCSRYISDEQTISDVLHDAFVVIFTSFEKLRDDSKAEAWMMSITRNVASKYKDYQDAHRTFLLEESTETNLLAEKEEEQDVRGIPLDEVISLVDKLPEGYGKVFRLSVFEGLSHKEIANILGIEPHSSSSQLARAKKMLRKMMRRYWLVFILLLVPLILILYRKDGVAPKDEKPIVEKQKPLPVESHHEKTGGSAIASVPKHQVTAVATDTLQDVITQELVMPDTLQDQEQSDTVRLAPKIGTIQHYDMADIIRDNPVRKTYHERRWSLELAYAGSLGEQYINLPYAFTETPMISPTGEAASPITFENWSDYAAYLSELPADDNSHTRSVIMNVALNNANRPETDKIMRTSHHYMPFTCSLALKYSLNNRISLESGLNYSRLVSNFEMGADGNAIREHQTIHYLGIPVKGIYNMYNKKAWSLYASAGITAEIPVFSSLSKSYYLHDVISGTDRESIHASWQWSIGTGIGVEYKLTPSIGLFVEPSMRYYIPTDSNIETYYTKHPFTFSLPLGIRFTW